MKKFLLALSVLLAVGGLAACDQFSNSPEQQAFKAFVAKCKADPSTADCKAWKDKSGPN